MDYEKKYKEALEKARQLCAYPTTKPFINDLQDLFPELRESEDGKIELIKETKGSEVRLFETVTNDEFVAWHEKLKEMKYEFVRFKTLATGEESHKWWFAAKTASQVMEHAEKFFMPTMQEGFNSAAHDAIESIFKFGGAFMNHPTNEVSSAIQCITEVQGYKRSSPMALFKVGNEMLKITIDNRLDEIDKGKTVYLEDGVREFGYSQNKPHFEIIERYYSDKLEYPDFKKPTLDDVRFIQWDGGKHWYAKVNKEDIVDELGNQKWDTKEDAEKAAEWYIKNYY